jgi:soluble cytochrome b562
MKTKEEAITRLKRLVKEALKDNADRRTASWNYQEGVLMSVNSAEEIIKFLEDDSLKYLHTEIGRLKRLVDMYEDKGTMV